MYSYQQVQTQGYPADSFLPLDYYCIYYLSLILRL